jgi:hypothetical protein
MSVNVNTAFVQNYSTNIMMLLQQQGSRLRNAVQTYSFTGKAASVVEQFGSVNPVRSMGRHSDTPLISTPQDKRWCFPIDYDWADLVDNQDQLRMLIDPRSAYTQAGVNAMGRAQDDEILAGLFGVNYTGENGTTATLTLYAYNSNSQSVAATVGGGSTAVGLNIAKLRAAKKILMGSDLDVDNDELYVVITAAQHDNLLNEAQAINLDYNTRPVLVDGRITSFMGFNFIHSERLPGASNFNSAVVSSVTSADSDGSYQAGSRWVCPFWAKSGMALGIWNDIQSWVTQRADKRMSWQVYLTETIGATRLEEKRCGVINCK